MKIRRTFHKDTASMIARVFVFIISINVAKLEGNLLTNGDFETTKYSSWKCPGSCMLSPSEDARQGLYSVMVSGRTKDYQGVTQNVNYTAGERYNVRMFVKLLNTTNNAPYQTVQLKEKCTLPDKNVLRRLSMTPRMKPGQWYEVGGLVKIADGSTNCKIYLQTAVPADYLVDDASVTHIPVSGFTEWMSKSEERIDQLRKADIDIQLTGPNSNSTSLDIELKQTKMQFPMGTAVQAFKIMDPEYVNYQNTFYENFEWAVLENALKWRPMEPQQGKINTEKPLTAMKNLTARGIKMRCHSVLWAADKKSPDWVQPLAGEALKKVVDERVSGVVNLVKGMCEDWDVNNELLHGDFFEHNLTNPSFTPELFHQVRSLDAKPRLMLNDFQVLRGSDITTATKNLALEYIAAGVPLGAIGAQSHMKIDLDVQLVKERLDEIAQAGLPVRITEFSVQETNENIKADHFRNLMNVFFSHPAVDGLLLWGFWDGQISNQEHALFTGPDVTPNAAGKVYQDFFHKTWRTNETGTISGNQAYSTRGFKGNYTLSIKYDGALLSTHTFTLPDAGRNLQINVEGNPGAPVVTEVTETK